MTEFGVMLAGMNGCIIPQFSSRKEAIRYAKAKGVPFLIFIQEIDAGRDGRPMIVTPWRTASGLSMDQARAWLEEFEG